MKKLFAFLFPLCVVMSCVYPTVEQELDACKSELVPLFHQADQQSEWMKALLDKKNVDLSELSLDQIKKTIGQLSTYKEKLMEYQQKSESWGQTEQRYLMLVQELIRQLTNARIAFEKRVSVGKSVKKVAIPVGAAVAVTGGLILLDLFTPLDIDLSTAVLCGVATGAAVGLVTYKGDVIKGLEALRESVKSVWRGSTWRFAGKAALSVAGAAAAGVMLWNKRDAIAGTLGFAGKPKKSLHDVAATHLSRHPHSSYDSSDA